MASDSSYSVAVDYAAMFRVLDPGWAADIIPDDNAGRSAELPLVVDEEGEDIFERPSEQERARRENEWAEQGAEIAPHLPPALMHGPLTAAEQFLPEVTSPGAAASATPASASAPTTAPPTAPPS